MRQSRFSRHGFGRGRSSRSPRAGRPPRRALAALAGFAALALLAAGAPAGAAEAEDPRDQYTERAEPVCKRNVQANKRIFRGAKGEVKRGELKKASRHFFKASRAFGKTIGQLARIPRPEADANRLKKWLGLLRKEKKLVLKIGRALKSGNKKKAESISLELNRNSNKANNTVLPFGFDYCRLEQSRFG